jgi:hypothetical protein
MGARLICAKGLTVKYRHGGEAQATFDEIRAGTLRH